MVVASPSDMGRERSALPAIVADLNAVAAAQNLALRLLSWETDAHPGFHPKGPQGVIDEALKIEDCDAIIGLFWKRFGSPVNDAETGTEHELNIAHGAWQKGGRPRIMLYFNHEPISANSPDELDQRKRVLEFMARCEARVW